MEKIYYVLSGNCLRDYKTIWRGTINELNNQVFGYTLECGNSWNSRISRNPKTGKSLVNALNKSANECRRYYDYYELVTEQDYLNAGGKPENDHITIYK